MEIVDEKLQVLVAFAEGYDDGDFLKGDAVVRLVAATFRHFGVFIP